MFNTRCPELTLSNRSGLDKLSIDGQYIALLFFCPRDFNSNADPRPVLENLQRGDICAGVKTWSL